MQFPNEDGSTFTIPDEIVEAAEAVYRWMKNNDASYLAGLTCEEIVRLRPNVLCRCILIPRYLNGAASQ
jgi:hypothetical protein